LEFYWSWRAGHGAPWVKLKTQSQLVTSTLSAMRGGLLGKESRLPEMGLPARSGAAGIAPPWNPLEGTLQNGPGVPTTDCRFVGLPLLIY